MRSWALAATFAAAAFVSSLVLLLTSAWVPWLEGSARSFVVGSGSMLAAFVVSGLWAALNAKVQAWRWDTRPLVSMHPRKPG